MVTIEIYTNKKLREENELLTFENALLNHVIEDNRSYMQEIIDHKEYIIRKLKAKNNSIYGRNVMKMIRED